MNTIYTILWSTVGILSTFNLLNIIKPSIEIHKYIWISIITYNFFYIIMCKKHPNKDYIFSNGYKIKYSFISILNIIVIIIIMPLFIQACIKIIQVGFNNYRGNIRELAHTSHIGIFIRRTITFGIIDATSLIAAVELVNENKKLLKWAILGIILYTITFGGRYVLMNFVIYYISAFLLIRKYKTIRIKRKYVVFCVLGLIAVTFGRGLGEMSFAEMIYLYYVGSLSFLQLILDNPLRFGLSEYTYGYMTFGFVIEPIVYFLKAFFGLDIDIPSYHFNIYAQPFYNIGTGGSIVIYNNNTTFFYHFLRDFGIVGIILGVAFIALICAALDNVYQKTSNYKVLLLLVFMTGVILTSSMMYTLLTIKATITILVVILSVKKSNINKQRE